MKKQTTSKRILTALLFVTGFALIMCSLFCEYTKEGVSAKVFWTGVGTLVAGAFVRNKKFLRTLVVDETQ